jgi:hypothetical protein
MTRSCIGLLIALLALTLSHSPAHACLAIGRNGPVQVKGEEALIVWDAAHQIEHFYRQAHFEDAPEDFGFLVPTPTQPELAEVTTPIFQQLFTLYRRPQPRIWVPPGAVARFSPHVEVLQHLVVAGMEASVLRANDAGVLDRWLSEHGYPSGPAVQAYFTPYIGSGWIITAFRVAPGRVQGDVATGIVRMSFQTERPFFPYSEAGRASREARPFRISIIAPQRMRGYLTTPATIGDPITPWVEPSFAGRPRNLARRVEGIPRGAVRGQPWLTTFEEPRSRRRAQDLFFEANPEQAPIASNIESQFNPR